MQVYTPWMQRQAALGSTQATFPGAPIARNALTEAESMESVASLSRASNLRQELASLASPIKNGLPLMSARKPRIHAAGTAPPLTSSRPSTGLRKKVCGECAKIERRSFTTPHVCFDILLSRRKVNTANCSARVYRCCRTHRPR